MLARDLVTLAGTDAPGVLVANSLPVRVMMSLWRSWTEMLSHLWYCITFPCFITHYLASSRVSLLCYILLCFASFALHCFTLKHILNHIVSSCTAVGTTAAVVVVVFVPDSAALTKLVGAPLLVFDYSTVTTIYLLRRHIPSELINHQTSFRETSGCNYHSSSGHTDKCIHGHADKCTHV